MKRVLNWGGNLVTVVLGVAMLLTVYATVTSRMNNGIPKLFGYQMYEVLSGSMEPGIHTGSVIFDKLGVDVKSLKKGDVITFRSSEDQKTLITHRIVDVTAQNGAPAFQTKGDANNAADSGFVPASNVVAKYGNITIPFIGYYLNFIKSRMGIILLMIVPGALLILSTLVSLFQEILKLEKEKKVDSANVSSETKVETPTEA